MLGREIESKGDLPARDPAIAQQDDPCPSHQASLLGGASHERFQFLPLLDAQPDLDDTSHAPPNGWAQALIPDGRRCTSHYIKIELDKLFGYDAFRNEVVWSYHSGGASSRYFGRKHDILLWYAKDPKAYFFDDADARVPYTESTLKAYNKVDPEGRRYKLITHRGGPEERVYAKNLDRGRLLTDVWEDIPHIANWSSEKVGYPTQKPAKLLERILRALSPTGGVVADFLCGGGTTPAVAQSLGRRWLGADISKLAIAITAERIARLISPRVVASVTSASGASNSPSTGPGSLDLQWSDGGAAPSKADLVAASPLPVVGHTVEQCGTYDIDKLARMRADEFRAFVLACYGARKWTGPVTHIHGTKGPDVLWVGGPEETAIITATDVRDFVEAVLRSRGPDERNGVMIAWNVDPSARAYAERVVVLGQQRPVQAVKLRLLALAGEEFRALVTAQRTEYQSVFALVLPPHIPRIGYRRISSLRYEFDITEARSMNPGGKLTNAQWDFAYSGLFVPTPGYELCRRAEPGAASGLFEADLTATHTFEDSPSGATATIACRVQDDLGGDRIQSVAMTVE